MENEALEILVNNESEWRRFIVKELETIKQVQLGNCKDISRLEVKSGIFGLLGGLIPASVLIVIESLKNKI